jgi:hypothetical protein
VKAFPLDRAIVITTLLNSGSESAEVRLLPHSLDDRERSALCMGCDLRRGCLPGPDRDRPPDHGLRNLVIGALSRAGPVNTAAALRHHSRDLTVPSPPFGISTDETNKMTERRSPAYGKTSRAVSPDVTVPVLVGWRSCDHPLNTALITFMAEEYGEAKFPSK